MRNYTNTVEVDYKIQELEKDITLLKEERIYELNKVIGNPKCSTLANRIQENLNAVVNMYESFIEKQEKVEDREQFDLLAGLLGALSKEISELSKKQPDGLVNGFKVGQINRVLKPLKELMNSEPSTRFLDVLVEVDVDSKTDKIRSTYSDTAVILSQFREACSEYRAKHYNIKRSFLL